MIRAINDSTELVAQIKGCHAVYAVGDINFDNTIYRIYTTPKLRVNLTIMF